MTATEDPNTFEANEGALLVTLDVATNYKEDQWTGDSFVIQVRDRDGNLKLDINFPVPIAMAFSDAVAEKANKLT